MTVRHDQTQPSFRAPTTVIADYLRWSVSLSYLLGQAWTGRLLIISTTLIGLLCGVYMVHANGPHFTATMLISPADSDNSLGGNTGGGGGLLAGLSGNIGAVALPKFTQFVLTKGSVGVAQDLDRKYGFLCRIYSSECNQVTHQWRERAGIKAWFNGILARLAGLPDPNGPRTAEDLATYIAGAVTTEENKNNSMVQIHYISAKPVFAAQFLAAVVKSTNDYIRAQSRDTQRRNVEYLTASAAKTTNVEQRLAIDTLLLQEERQLMMTEVDVPYAAKVLDGPTITPIHNALKIIAIYSIAGFILGSIAASSRELLPRKWRLW
jgi:hypothetical protein